MRQEGKMHRQNKLVKNNMKLKLLIDGSDYRIVLIPEGKADKKLLEFVGAHSSAEIVLKRHSGMYSDNFIESVQILLAIPSTVDETIS